MTDKMKELLRQVRRTIEDTTDWNELYGVEGEISNLARLADDREIELHDEYENG